MKKIIIAAAIVCVAAFAQAASYNWKAANVYDAAGTALYSGSATLTALSMAGVEIGTWDATMSNGAISQVISSTDFVAGQNYKFTYTMATADGKSTFTSNLKIVKANISATMDVNFAAGGTWTTATPEPTSAMLMLLGMAGLALRRKQK